MAVAGSGVEAQESSLAEECDAICELHGVCVWKQSRRTSVAVAGSGVEAQESSLAEECDAICELHGVRAGAPLALQLKAIDAEYHQLLDKGQSGKADHVQTLFAWKSKMASQVSLCLTVLTTCH